MIEENDGEAGGAAAANSLEPAGPEGGGWLDTLVV